MTVRILDGDCRDVLRTLPDASVDSVVTDPPYELGFMGKSWDSTGIAYDVTVWRECLRVLKPGGHLLAFGGSRTYHRLACAVEDAGFEIRDQIMWIYGSGFPKSLDVSKAIDKSLGGEREQTRAGIVQRGGLGEDWDTGSSSSRPRFDKPATEAARQWQGWGTALKPAHEPIVVARKPLIGTVAANVLAHGTGALNIDASRVQHDEECRMMAPSQANIERPSEKHRQAGRRTEVLELKPSGRWPANIIHDGSEEVLEAFPEAPGQLADASTNADSKKTQNVYGAMNRGNARDGEASADSENDGAVGFKMRPGARRLDSGSAARFFYTAKASRSDRNIGCEMLQAKPLNWSSGQQSPGTFQSENTNREAQNHHPTVKPTDLMRYLVKLVTPPGGTVLDPFAGSGSTGRGADIEQFDAILIELNPEYAAIARKRISGDAPLFASVA